MGGFTAEQRATARIQSPTDIGLLIERTAAMTEGTLDMLQDEYVEFRSKKAGIPRGFVETLTKVSGLLNELTLAHGRYRKAEDEWADKMSPEEKLEATRAYLLALHKDQPDLVRRWLTVTSTAVNHATAATAGLVKERAIKPTDMERFEASDPGDSAWGP